MMTRHGRSWSTVSSVLPKMALACLGGSGMTIARARSSRASSTMRRPACPARTFSQCPVTRRPPCRRACSMSACAAASCSGIDASIGADAGTAIGTRTWIPRRRRAAIRTAVETAPGE